MSEPYRLELVSLALFAPDALSSYGPNGTRTSGGKLYRRTELRPLKAFQQWKATRATAEAIVALDRVCLEEGLDLRITEAFRSPRTQAEERTKYDAWVRAGRPSPGTGRFSNATMRTAYVARPGRSNHGWGGAIDIDIEAMCPDTPTESRNARLARFWGVAAKFGFTPILAHPFASHSEAWHFDRFGALSRVRDMYAADSRYAADAYGHTAEVGALLALTHQDGESDRGRMRQVQAWLAFGGFCPGPPDGLWGKQTAAACKAAGIAVDGESPDPLQLLAQIKQAGIGRDGLANL